MNSLEYLTPAEVAQILGVSLSTLARWRAEGDGPDFVRLGSKTVRYSRAQLVEWLDESGAVA